MPIERRTWSAGAGFAAHPIAATNGGWAHELRRAEANGTVQGGASHRGRTRNRGSRRSSFRTGEGMRSTHDLTLRRLSQGVGSSEFALAARQVSTARRRAPLELVHPRAGRSRADHGGTLHEPSRDTGECGTGQRATGCLRCDRTSGWWSTRPIGGLPVRVRARESCRCCCWPRRRPWLRHREEHRRWVSGVFAASSCGGCTTPASALPRMPCRWCRRHCRWAA
jgi:hypothetical protein